MSARWCTWRRRARRGSSTSARSRACTASCAKRFIRGSAAIWAACRSAISTSTARRRTWIGISGCTWSWRGRTRRKWRSEPLIGEGPATQRHRERRGSAEFNATDGSVVEGDGKPRKNAPRNGGMAAWKATLRCCDEESTSQKGGGESASPSPVAVFAQHLLGGGKRSAGFGLAGSDFAHPVHDLPATLQLLRGGHTFRGLIRILRVPICEGWPLMPPSWFLRFWIDRKST